MNGMTELTSWMTAGVLLLCVLLIFRKAIGRLVRFALRSTVGLVVLALLEQFGGLIGIRLGVNLANALLLGILGVPGFGLLLMLQWALR